MDQRELLRLVASLFDESRLKGVENHAEGRRARCALRVPFVRLTIDMLFQDDIRRRRQRRFQIFRDGNDGHAFRLADIDDRQQFFCLAAAGREDHHIAFLQESCRAMDGFRRRNESRGPFDAAHQMREMLADDARMAAPARADARRGGQ